MARNAKGIQNKSRTHEVIDLSGGRFEVTSGVSGEVYSVTIDGDAGAHCTCDWAKYRPAGVASGCSHVVSVHNHIAQQAGYKAMAWASPEDAQRQHRHVVEVGDGLTLTLRKA